MADSARTEHWNAAHGGRNEREASWFEDEPRLSLALIARAGTAPTAAVIDIGAGTARLADALIGQGFADVSVLDLSAAAVARIRARIGPTPALHTITADVTRWRPDRRYALWHDRAAFHFLVDPADRAAYASAIASAVVPGGHAIIATFAPDGPERCSGLPVMRHDQASILASLGPGWEGIEAVRHEHRTPAGAVQRFQFSLLLRRPDADGPA